MKIILILFVAMLTGCASTGETAFYAQQAKAAESKAMIDAAKVESQTARYKAIEAVAARADASTLAVLASGLNSEGAVLAALSNGNASQPAQTFVQAPESGFDKALRTLAVVGGLARDIVVPVRLAQYARDTIIKQSDNAVASETVRTNGYVAINGQTAGLGAAIANKPAPQPNITITHNCQGGQTGNGGNGSPGGNSGTASGGTGTATTPQQPINSGAAGTGGAGGASGSANGGNC